MINFKQFIFEKKGDPDSPFHVKSPSTFDRDTYRKTVHGNKVDRLHNKLDNEASEQSILHDDKHEEHIHNYKDESAHYNEPLRTSVHYITQKGKADFEDKIKHMDDVTSHKTKHNFHVYRGMDKHNFDLKDYPVGSVHHDKGYTGTSLSINQAKGFAYRHGQERKYDGKKYPHVIARIHITPGTKGHYLDTYQREHINNDEKEFLLHRGTKFRVTGHSYDPAEKAHIVHMKIHSQEDH